MENLGEAFKIMIDDFKKFVKSFIELTKSIIKKTKELFEKIVICVSYDYVLKNCCRIGNKKAKQYLNIYNSTKNKRIKKKQIKLIRKQMQLG